MSFLLPLLLQAASPLCGTWQFYSYIYQGQQVAAPNPELYEILEFKEPHILRLYYKHDDEDGFCERQAHYDWTNGNLKQQIFWVNPDNQPNCNQDPDMQNNKTTINKAELKDGVFYLDMPLGDGTITYLWKKISECGVQPPDSGGPAPTPAIRWWEQWPQD